MAKLVATIGLNGLNGHQCHSLRFFLLFVLSCILQDICLTLSGV